MHQLQWDIIDEYDVNRIWPTSVEATFVISRIFLHAFGVGKNLFAQVKEINIFS